MTIGPTTTKGGGIPRVSKPPKDHTDPNPQGTFHVTTPEGAVQVFRATGVTGDKVAVAGFSVSGMGMFASGGTGIGLTAQGDALAADFIGGVRMRSFLNVEDRGRIGGDLHVDRSLFVRTDIQMVGGDYAEDFDLVGDTQPGSVMVIDDQGRLGVCATEYDRRVAGVLSGAGDQAPAIVLGRPNGPQPGRRPLALMGKVWAMVDAEPAGIAIGDLLTTSATPGHVMKAADPPRAFGAGVGQALHQLRAGRGMVPILVALQ